MPYGLARTQAAEQQVRLVEAEGPDGARSFALLALVDSLVWGGEVDRAYLPFTKAVRWYDEHPEHVDATDTHALFWSFKWMVGHLSDFPSVPSAQIEATLEDMERRYAVAGLGRDAVAYERFSWSCTRGAPDVQDRYDEWVRTPRDDFSQCEACDPADRAFYLVESGRRDEGVRLLETTIAAGKTCATEPADMLSLLALAYLDEGRAADAVSAHRRAVAALASTQSDMAGARGRRFVLLARGGQPERALRAVADDAALLLTTATPAARFEFLHSVVEGTAALLPKHAATPVQVGELQVGGVPVSDVAGLHAWAAAEAATLAAQFDARNGTDRYARRLAAARAARPAAVVLDLAVIPAGGPSAASAVRAPSSGASPSGVPDEGATEPPDARADRLWRAGELGAAATAWLEAADLAEAEGRLADAGIAAAEAARCAQQLGDDDGAAATYPSAVARLRAGGVAPQDLAAVVVAWAPSAVATGTGDRVLLVADELVADLERAADESAAAADGAAGVQLAERVAAARRRAGADLHDTAARVLASLGPQHAEAAAARAARAGEAYAGAGATADAAHAFWLAGRLHASLGRVDDAVWNLESAVEGFGIARQRGPRGEAASTLVEVLRAAGRDAEADTLLRTLTQ
ncbi:hypothetical protein CCO02nite_05420 [Cellulomonas composti]|uniref:Tetratricopeptide repeat protein n=2 Tax=Cellulomonas composti TaxID=266130 RepID=A0A511J7D1_9CELL|nr:hypothetical protein CCO02nite_05420 [Cellulomonas composti]